MASDMCHVSSIVVHARPAALDAVAAAIAELPGAEIHGRDAAGKLVVVLTAASERTISDHLQTINAIAGVFTASMVYHAVDDA
ncbi:MAG TPA: chaperone NapD [Dongiaceae bacterium]